MIKYNGKQYVCNIVLRIDLIKGEWNAVILCHLNDRQKYSQSFEE